MIDDYRIYKFTGQEKIRCIIEGIVLDGVIAFLFYDSLSAMLPGIFLLWLYSREKRKAMARKRMYRMRADLKDFFQVLIAALQTGRSMENAFVQSLKDMTAYREKEMELLTELRRICAGVSVGESLEKLLEDFSRRSHLEELEYFSEVFSVAKRSGGNVIAVMKNTIRMLQERMEAYEEIHTVIAEKQLEFYVMCVIPLAMIAYLRVSAGNFLQCLYGNPTGIAVMTICLGIYGGCYLYGKKLLEFEN